MATKECATAADVRVVPVRAARLMQLQSVHLQGRVSRTMLKRVFIITLPITNDVHSVWTPAEAQEIAACAHCAVLELERLKLEPENECPSSPH